MWYIDFNHTHLDYKQVQQVKLKRSTPGFILQNVCFDINWLSPNIILLGNKFLFIKLLTIFCAVFMSLLMVSISKII